MKKCLFMFALLIVTIVAAALTNTKEIKELNNDLVVAEQFVGQQVSIQKPKN
ncbi:hypothetical protein [Zobellia barbeyronii]|uniref:Uncharacterized protein n=1 Tax=Zobellia barbeyronii TaxID=2748009 RepID=A0ABS5WAR6_9FLAO|nr:hypothetical protein [Zobellia barbeyronii]MBT2160478.1 hypothetical protein [Zobellia barbeyronii]